jgi:hypothetical protein
MLIRKKRKWSHVETCVCSICEMGVVVTDHIRFTLYTPTITEKQYLYLHFHTLL